ncbi:hypothetical protein RND71_032915 [Anisodus tanguticus]|uniref:Uncharacterized protein n=1 Tax=Anisodus tanguticus TaxID=243964 RepID=A0AAE1R7E5_9SOLA|nr:hypothetical protein RND71_032915 [Anisodus tanguticus]
MSISEDKIRFQRQMQAGEATETMCIGFVDDANGVSNPTNLPFSPRGLKWQEKTVVTRNKLQRMRKLKTKKGNGVWFTVETCKWMSCYHFCGESF